MKLGANTVAEKVSLGIHSATRRMILRLFPQKMHLRCIHGLPPQAHQASMLLGCWQSGCAILYPGRGWGSGLAPMDSGQWVLGLGVHAMDVSMRGNVLQGGPLRQEDKEWQAGHGAAALHLR